MDFNRGIISTAAAAALVVLCSCGDGGKIAAPGGANPPATGSAQSPNIPVPKPVDPPKFSRASYTSVDGKASIAMISPTELEYKKGETTFACQYSRDNLTVRVVLDVAGTKTVEYFSESGDGLRADNGTMLYVPTALDRAVRQAQEDDLKRQQRELDEKAAAAKNVFLRSDYIGLDRKSKIALISATELEYSTGDKTYSCQYSRDGGRIRAVIEAAGTKTVQYFNDVPEGLRTDDGTIFYVPARLDVAIARQQLEAVQREKQALEEKIAREKNAFVPVYYSSVDGKAWVALKSPSELEYRKDNTTLLCGYTREQGRVRVVADVRGTKIVEYFSDAPEGMKTESGTMLFLPAFLKIAQERALHDETWRQQQLLDEKIAKEKRAFVRVDFTAADGHKSAAIVSPTELEYRGGDKTLLCPYTREQGRLRVIVESHGAKTVEYLTETPDGLRADDGTILYNPAKFEVVQARVREAAFQAALEQQRKDEAAARAAVQVAGQAREKAPRPKAPIEVLRPSIDYVIQAEDSLHFSDWAGAIQLYDKAVLAAETEANTVQAKIFAARRAEIERLGKR